MIGVSGIHIEQSVVSNGLLTDLAAYLDFEEGSGQFTDKVGSYDSTTVSANYSETGINGDAVGFVKADSDYVVFSAWTGLGTIDRSLSVWFKTPSSQSDYGRVVVFAKDNSSADEPAFNVSLQSTDGRCSVGLRGSYTISSSALATGTWHHAVQTVDASTRRYEFYLDGAYVGGGFHSAGFVGANPILNIGRYNSYYNQNASSTVDELAVYTNRILSLSDVQSIYNSGSGRFLNDFTS